VEIEGREQSMEPCF